MPYYWSTVKNIYNLAPDNWKKDNIAIVSDLAWFVIRSDDTPQQLVTLVNNAWEGQENWREPRSNENCQFKTWYDRILTNDVSSGHRNSLMRALLNGDIRNITDNQACFIVHLLPCDIIHGFIQHTNSEIESYLTQLAQHFVPQFTTQELNIDSSNVEPNFNNISDTEYYSSDDTMVYDCYDEYDDETDDESDDETDDESEDDVRDDESDDESDGESDGEDAVVQFLRGILTQQELRDYNRIRTSNGTVIRPTYIHI